MTFIFSLLIFLPKVLIGFAIAHLLWKDSDVSAIILKLSVGVPLELAISASIFFISMLAGISPRLYSWIELCLFLILSVPILILIINSMRKHMKILKPSQLDILEAIIILAGAFLGIGVFLSYSNMQPYGLEDAWSMWNLTPRFIFRGNSPAVLLNSQFYNRFHPDYPVELSLNVAWGWFVINGETTRVPIALALLTTFTPAIIAWVTLRRWKGFIVGALGSLIIFLIPDLPSAVGQYADPLLALHAFSATALFYGYLKSRHTGLLILVGLLVGFSAWVKNEGILLIGVFLAVYLFAAWIHEIQWNTLKSLAIGLFIPILVVVIYKYVVGLQNDLFSGTNSPYLQITDFSRWVIIGKSFVMHFIRYANWPISIILILLVYATLTKIDHNEVRQSTLLFLLFIGQLAGYFFIYLITPYNLQTHIMTSMDRLISHLMPVAILWVFATTRSLKLKIGNES